MFPTLVGALLAGLGAVIALRSLRVRRRGRCRASTPRPIGVSLLAIVLFGIALQWLGLVAAVAVLVLVGAYASRDVRAAGDAGARRGLDRLLGRRCSSGCSACRCRCGRIPEAGMETLNNLAFGLGVALSWQNILYCFIGCFLGTLVGVLPGIGPVATVAMLLPFTFGLEPAPALIMLAGIYYGAQYGGSTTAILVNIPGESSSVVTTLDGYQMARQRPRRAGARHRRDRLVHRRLHRDAGGRLFRPAAGRGRAQVRPGGIFFADGVRPDRGGRAGARLAAQGDRHGVLRHPARADRHRRQFRRDPLRLRLARARRRASASSRSRWPSSASPT